MGVRRAYGSGSYYHGVADGDLACYDVGDEAGAVLAALSLTWRWASSMAFASMCALTSAMVVVDDG